MAAIASLHQILIGIRRIHCFDSVNARLFCRCLLRTNDQQSTKWMHASGSHVRFNCSTIRYKIVRRFHSGVDLPNDYIVPYSAEHLCMRASARATSLMRSIWLRYDFRY